MGKANNKMRISIAGDLCSEGRIRTIIEEGNYHCYFSDVKEYLKNSNYSLVNLECPICDSNYAPIPKCGPNIKSSKDVLDLVKYMGFNAICLANNHIRDFGDNGIHNTIEQLKKANYDYVGIGDTLEEASTPLYKSINERDISIINCCEHEFSIVGEGKAGAAPMNPIALSYKIKEAKTKCDYVILVIHGGCEHYHLPTPRMVETYRFFIDCGADAIINHHQHCYSGYEIYKGKPIFYGLGNFCFDANNPSNDIWNRGIIVTIDFGEKINFEIIPYVQNAQKVGINIYTKESQAYKSVMDDIKSLSAIISDPKELEKRYKQFIESTNTFYKNAIEPYRGHYIKALYEKGFLPSLYNKDKKILLYNLIACESHRERLLSSLQNAFEKYE